MIVNDFLRRKNALINCGAKVPLRSLRLTQYSPQPSYMWYRPWFNKWGQILCLMWYSPHKPNCGIKLAQTRKGEICAWYGIAHSLFTCGIGLALTSKGGARAWCSTVHNPTWWVCAMTCAMFILAWYMIKWMNVYYMISIVFTKVYFCVLLLHAVNSYLESKLCYQCTRFINLMNNIFY